MPIAWVSCPCVEPEEHAARDGAADRAHRAGRVEDEIPRLELAGRKAQTGLGFDADRQGGQKACRPGSPVAAPLAPPAASASASRAGSVVESAWLAGFHIGSKSSTCMAAPFARAASAAARSGRVPDQGCDGLARAFQGSLGEKLRTGLAGPQSRDGEAVDDERDAGLARGRVHRRGDEIRQLGGEPAVRLIRRRSAGPRPPAARALRQGRASRLRAGPVKHVPVEQLSAVR